MKRAIRSALSAIVVICLLSTSLFTGSTLAISESTNTLRNQIITAVNSLIATNSTTASDIEDAVTSVDSTASIEWILPFRKNDAMNGVKIKVGTTEYGEVSPHNGSVTGLLAITASGDTFNVSVNSEIKASYDAAVICNSVKEVTITSSSDTFSSLGGNLTDANQLVIINSNIGAIPEKFMGTSDSPRVTDSVSVKAIIVKDKVVVGNQALCRLQNMLALTFEKGVTTINNYALRASNKLAYLDLGSTGATLTFGNAGTLSYLQALKNLYIGGYASVSIGDATFEGSTILNNIVIDCPVTNVGTNVFNNAGSSQNICCVDSTSAGRFTTGTVTDLSSRTIIEYFEKICEVKVVSGTGLSTVETKVDALNTEGFTVSTSLNDGAFEVSITDANSVTAIAYVEIFNLPSLKSVVKRVLDDFPYTVDTTNDDIEDYIRDRVIAEYDITWVEDYYATEKVDGAEVWARANSSSAYELKGTVPGQNGMAYGSFYVESNSARNLVRISNTAETAEYEKYELTGIQTTNGSADGTEYNGTAELIIATSTINYRHLDGTVIDSVLDGSYSQNIKAVIVRGTLSNWNCFANLSGLEVAIIENTSITELGRQQFKNCSNLKYVYLPDNITTTKDAQSFNNQTAFYGCTSLKTVLVGPNFDRSTFIVNYVNSVIIRANVMRRDNVEFCNHSLLLDDAIGVNFFTNLSVLTTEEKATSYMTFEITKGTGGKTVIGKIANYNSEFTSETGGYYGFTCPLSSVQMAEKVMPTLHYTIDGVEKALVGKPYSVKDYIETVKDDSVNYSLKLRTLVKSIGDYGHYAQVYLGGRNNWSAGTDYTAIDTYLNTSYSGRYTAVRDAVLSDGKSVSASGLTLGWGAGHYRYRLNFDSTTSIELRIGHLSYASADTDYTNELFDNGSPTEYGIYLMNISASNLSTVYHIVANVDGQPCTINISALSFVYDILNNGGSTSESKDIACALCYYSSAVSSYLGLDSTLNTEFV